MSEKKYTLAVPPEVRNLIHSPKLGRVFPSLREAREVSKAVKVLFPEASIQVVSQVRREVKLSKTLRG